MIVDLLNSPTGWVLTHIINLEPSWQVNLRSDEHVVVATGETIEAAMLSASLKIANHSYNGTLFRLASRRLAEAKTIEANNGRQLLLALGLGRASAPIKRRI